MLVVYIHVDDSKQNIVVGPPVDGLQTEYYDYVLLET